MHSAHTFTARASACAGYRKPRPVNILYSEHVQTGSSAKPLGTCERKVSWQPHIILYKQLCHISRFFKAANGQLRPDPDKKGARSCRLTADHRTMSSEMRPICMRLKRKSFWKPLMPTHMMEAPSRSSPDGSWATNTVKAPLLSPWSETEEPHIESHHWSAWDDLHWKLCVMSGLMDFVQSRFILLKNLMDKCRMASAADRVLGPRDHMCSRRKVLLLSSISIWLSLYNCSGFREILVISPSYSTHQRVQLLHPQASTLKSWCKSRQTWCH